MPRARSPSSLLVITEVVPVGVWPVVITSRSHRDDLGRGGGTRGVRGGTREPRKPPATHDRKARPTSTDITGHDRGGAVAGVPRVAGVAGVG